MAQTWYKKSRFIASITVIILLLYKLSKSYNATVLYFAKYLFSRACIKPIIFSKQKFNQLSNLPHNGFNNLFPTVQETNHFMEVGWLKKNEMNGDVPVFDMRYAFRAA